MDYINILNKYLKKIFYLIVCFYVYIFIFSIFLFKFDFYNKQQCQLFNVVIFFILSFSIFLYLLFYKKESELKKIIWFISINTLILLIYTISCISFLAASIFLFGKELYAFLPNLINVLMVLILSAIFIFEDDIRNKTPGEIRLNFISLTSYISCFLGLFIFFAGIIFIKNIFEYYIGLYSKSYLPFLEFFRIIIEYDRESIYWFLYLLFITFIGIQYFINYFIKNYAEKILIREMALKESIKYFIYLFIFIFFTLFLDIKKDFLDGLILMPLVMIFSVLMASLGSILKLNTKIFIISILLINILLLISVINTELFNGELGGFLLIFLNANKILIVRGFMFGIGVIFASILGILISKWKDLLFTKKDIDKTTKKEFSSITGISSNTVEILNLYKNNINSSLLEKLEKENKIKKVEFLILKDRFLIK